ncbi:MAG: aminomethyltransferase beta-barrel domain-containing protein, partial [Dongiaceae bacterium]
IVHVDGRVLGRHDGIIGFTVGQRRGLRLADSTIENGAPLFVVRIDAARHRVVVGPRTALAVNRMALRDMNWLGAEPIAETGLKVSVKLRSTMPPVPARIHAAPNGAGVTLVAPQLGVAPGQACVVYDGEHVLGGGWIGQTAMAVAA